MLKILNIVWFQKLIFWFWILSFGVVSKSMLIWIWYALHAGVTACGFDCQEPIAGPLLPSASFPVCHFWNVMHVMMSIWCQKWGQWCLKMTRLWRWWRWKRLWWWWRWWFYLWASTVSSAPPKNFPPIKTRGTDDPPVIWDQRYINGDRNVPWFFPN